MGCFGNCLYLNMLTQVLKARAENIVAFQCIAMGLAEGPFSFHLFGITPFMGRVN